MRVTVCQLPEDQEQLDIALAALKEHLVAAESQFLLLPEMPFSKWLPRTQAVDPNLWQQAVVQHQQRNRDFQQLGVRCITGTQPILSQQVPYNEAFVWQHDSGMAPVHRKYYLPEEPEFWEASWYRKGPKSFKTFQATHVRVGFLICTEMWFTDCARSYAREGIELLLCPRATAGYSKDKWVAGGIAAAVMAGAFCLSSNRGGKDACGMEWAGCGWIISPEGEVLGKTDSQNPFLTLDLDLSEAHDAKTTYPRYISEA